MTALTFLRNLIHDARLSIRSLRSSPGFTSAVVLLLGLGIGANVAVLSVAELLFVRPPAGVAHPETLRRLYLRSNWSVGRVTVIRSEFSFPVYVALRDAYRAKVQLAGFTKADTELIGDGERVRVAHATASFFPVLGIVPALGRGFGMDEDHPGDGRPVAVISDAFWRSHFGSDPHVLGRPLDIEFTRYTIIGVTPQGSSGPDLARTDIWVPMAMYPTGPGPAEQQWYRGWRRGFITRIVARVPAGASETDPWLTSLGTVTYRRGEIANVERGADSTGTVLVAPILESLGPSITPSVENAITARLLGVTVILLLIAFANVGNLLIGRALARRNEIAIRIALGISRLRLIAQLVTESILLSLFAALLSLVPAVWGAVVLRRLLMPGVPFSGPLLDVHVFSIAIGLATIGGLAAGLLPAWRVRNFDIISDIKGTRGQELPSRLALRNVLVAAQAALSVLLLVGAGVFMRSLHEVRAIDLGYNTDRLVYGSVDFRDPQTHQIDYFSSAIRDARITGLHIAAANMAHMPGVEAVALSTSGPMRGYAMVRLMLADGTRVPRLRDRDAATLWVSSTFLDVTGIKLARGRFFNAGEEAAQAPVVVVNETAAKLYWPDRDPIGQCLRFFTPTSPCSTVVGIMRDPHLDGIIEEPTAQLYLPLNRASVIITRAAPGRNAQVAASMAAELRQVFPTAEPPEVVTLESMLEPELRPWRLGATLFSVFGVLALLIAAFGLYSVVSYSVSQRTRELGIRAALGADPRMLVSQVVGDGLKAPIVGFVIGMILAVALWPAIAAMVYHVKPTDPETIISVATVLVATALLATIVPATRAARVDVIRALRAE